MMCELHLNKVDRKRLWGNKKEQLHPVHTTGAVLGWCLEVTKTDEGLEASQVNSGTRDFHVLLKIMRDQESWGGVCVRCSRLSFQKFHCAITGHAQGKDRAETDNIESRGLRRASLACRAFLRLLGTV